MDEKEIIRILHIDDEQEHLFFSKKLLSMHEPSFKIKSISCPNKALDILTKERFDCIVSDYLMPNLNGIELASKIKEHEDVPFILYTGQGSEEAAEKAFKTGIDDYMRKELSPSHYKILAKRIKSVVEKKKTEIRFRSLFENSPEAISIHGFNGEIRSVNPEFEQLTGLRKKDVIGKRISEIIKENNGSKKQVNIIKGIYSNLIKDRKIQPFEFKFNHPDGEIIWVEVNASLIEEKGEVDGIQVILHDITERKKMEQKIINAEKRWESLFELAPEGVMIFNTKGIITALNQTILEDTGFTESELIGKHFSKMGIIDIKQLPTYFQIFKSIMTGDLKSKYILNFKHKDGSIGMGEVRVNVIETSINKKEILFIGRDITEKHNIEKQLSDTKESLMSFMNSATDGFAILDSQLNFVEVNNTLLTRSGLQREDYMRKNIVDLFPDAQSSGRTQEYRNVIKTGIPYSTEIYETKFAERYVDLKAFKVRDGLGLITTDVTHVKKFEAKLEGLHRHASALAGVNEYNEIYDVTLEAMKEILGFEFSSVLLVDSDILNIIRSSGDTELGKTINLEGEGLTARAARTQSTILVKNTGEDPDYLRGTIPAQSELDVPVIVDNRCVAVLNTESLKQDAFAEQDKKLLEILANHVASAYSRIKYLKELEKMKDERIQGVIDGASKVSAMIRHDLRSPLRNIKNACYLTETDPSLIDEMRELVNRNIDYAYNILGELSLLSEIDELKIKHENINSVINNSLKSLVIPKGIEVQLVEKDKIKTSIDKTKIQRVLYNLLNNALEAMPEEGGLTINIFEQDRKCVIKISDTGKGISKEIYSSIFQPFYSTKENGMGLGLTYCKRVIESHEGTIDFISKIGEGTTFVIEIPIKTRLEASMSSQIATQPDIHLPN